MFNTTEYAVSINKTTRKYSQLSLQNITYCFYLICWQNPQNIYLGNKSKFEDDSSIMTVLWSSPPFFSLMTFLPIWYLAHSGCDRSSEVAYSPIAPDPTSVVWEIRVGYSPVLKIFFGLLNLNTLSRHVIFNLSIFLHKRRTK